jgi:hypothetical protein
MPAQSEVAVVGEADTAAVQQASSTRAAVRGWPSEADERRAGGAEPVGRGRDDGRVLADVHGRRGGADVNAGGSRRSWRVVRRYGSPASACSRSARSVSRSPSPRRPSVSTGALSSSQSTPALAHASRQASALSQASARPFAAATRTPIVPSGVPGSSAWLSPVTAAASSASGRPRAGSRRSTSSACRSNSPATSRSLRASRRSTPVARSSSSQGAIDRGRRRRRPGPRRLRVPPLCARIQQGPVSASTASARLSQMPASAGAPRGRPGAR